MLANLRPTLCIPLGCERTIGAPRLRFQVCFKYGLNAYGVLEGRIHDGETGVTS